MKKLPTAFGAALCRTPRISKPRGGVSALCGCLVARDNGAVDGSDSEAVALATGAGLWKRSPSTTNHQVHQARFFPSGKKTQMFARFRPSPCDVAPRTPDAKISGFAAVLNRGGVGIWSETYTPVFSTRFLEFEISTRD